MLLFPRIEENTVTEKACSKKQRTISLSDLPLCCPMPNERLWDAHPRVYLDIKKTGWVACPYCETEYHLDKKSA